MFALLSTTTSSSRRRVIFHSRKFLKNHLKVVVQVKMEISSFFDALLKRHLPREFFLFIKLISVLPFDFPLKLDL